jgi:hypothetical protein
MFGNISTNEAVLIMNTPYGIIAVELAITDIERCIDEIDITSLGDVTTRVIPSGPPRLTVEGYVQREIKLG